MGKTSNSSPRPSPRRREQREGSSSFASDLLVWFEKHGRKDLPWQQDRTPYRVWVSEIMLQQTQVSTVIGYFNRFMQRFPDVAALAAAPVDEVLHLWSGLGYYARARNLHRAAQQIMEQHGGEFPWTLEQAVELPGIGRSTAGAILSLACGQRQPILDGNVKRVLARYFVVEGFPGLPAITDRLWEYADQCTPGKQVDKYTQAIMDLGATLCTRSRPTCAICPVSAGCAALATNRQNQLPTARPRKERPQKQTFMLLALRDQSVLLERRPAAGLWGGLWGLPEFKTPAEAQAWCRTKFGKPVGAPRQAPPLHHAFTHFDLRIEPLLIQCAVKGQKTAAEVDGWLWYDPARPAKLGLAAPVKELIDAHVRPM
jgi:A/G-specific adenine glycosylase